MREEIIHSAERKYELKNDLIEEQFKTISPISKEDFNDLFIYCDSVSIPDGYRYLQKKDLLRFLCKLRQSLSDELLRVMFHYSSSQTMNLAISTVRQSLMIRFVNENIGFGAITREDYIEWHVTPFSNQLYNDTSQNPKVIIYNDYTYLHIEKNACLKLCVNHFVSIKTDICSKPSMLMAPDRYILDIQGPYFSNATNNDDRILLKEFQSDVNGM